MSMFHDDELRVQRLAQSSTTGMGIRAFMPEQHRTFFANLPYAFLSVNDSEGWPIGTIVAGAPGFLSAPTEDTLMINLSRDDTDPALKHINVGREIGLLGLDLATRRRNRANGTLSKFGDGGMEIAVSQSFGNCPKYIWPRRVSTVERNRGPLEELNLGDPFVLQTIAAADTVFVASRAGRHIQQNGGLDMSHRAGEPGFIKRRGDVLVVPDYAGNGYFNTMGNFQSDPRAALLFVDFSTADLLFVQGVVDIDWQAQADGSERGWQFDMRRTWRRRGAVGLEWIRTEDRALGYC